MANVGDKSGHHTNVGDKSGHRTNVDGDVMARLKN